VRQAWIIILVNKCVVEKTKTHTRYSKRLIPESVIFRSLSVKPAIAYLETVNLIKFLINSPFFLNVEGGDFRGGEKMR